MTLPKSEKALKGMKLYKSFFGMQQYEYITQRSDEKCVVGRDNGRL